MSFVVRFELIWSEIGQFGVRYVIKNMDCMLLSIVSQLKRSLLYAAVSFLASTSKVSVGFPFQRV